MKEYRKESPFDRLPLSKKPSSLVTVWGTESWLVQITMLPTEMVIVFGLKANPEMLISVEDGAGDGSGVDGDGADGAGVGDAGVCGADAG